MYQASRSVATIRSVVCEWNSVCGVLPGCAKRAIGRVVEVVVLVPMPTSCSVGSVRCTRNGRWYCGTTGIYSSMGTGDTEADARAEMLVYLIEQELVKPVRRAE